jgi:zinc protease
VAHFLEHLMFKGTGRFPDDAFERFAVANGGGSPNAFTSHDFTVFPLSLPKGHLAALMEREADRMVNLRLSEEDIAPERRVVQNERRGNENSPAYQLIDRVYAALFPGHPYGRSVIGTEAEIERLDRKAVLDFYRRHYAPNNAVLVVAGDVSEAEVRRLAERTWGRIPARRDLPPRTVHPLPARPQEPRVELSHDRVTTPSVGFYYLTPGLVALPPEDAHALDLLCRIAGGAVIGRLHRSLVQKERVAISVSASHELDLQAGVLSFAASAAPGVTAADLEAALGREIAALARDGVTEAEADDARQGYLAAKAYEDDSHRERARLYGEALASGHAIADVDAADPRVARVTAAHVSRVAGRYVAAGAPVVGVLRPQAVGLAAEPPGTAGAN